MLAVTNVIRDVWRQREEDGESVDAIGSELIWGEIEPELREDWDMVWAEHVEDCMPTFTEDKVQVGEGDEDSDDSDDSVELTRSVVGV